MSLGVYLLYYIIDLSLPGNMEALHEALLAASLVMVQQCMK